MSIDEVCKWLERYGSSQDPIFCEGEETTPEEISYAERWQNFYASGQKLLDKQINFYGDLPNGKFGLVTGSFADMIADRIFLYRKREMEAEEKERKRRKQVKYVVSYKVSEGFDPCGRNDWTTKSETFTNLKEARKYFNKNKSQYCAKLRKITDELLDESA